MMDDASRPGEDARRLHRGTGEQERDTGPGWFSPQTDSDPMQGSGPQERIPAEARQSPESWQPQSQQSQQSQQPQPRQPENRPPENPPPDPRQAEARQSPEQRYADAISAMNRMVTTLDFEALPWVTEVFRATAGVLPEGNPARPGVLNNLGTASQLTFVGSKDLGDLDDAVSYYRAAASTAREDDPDLVLYQCNLALALTDRATQTDDAASAKESAQVARQATEHTSRRDQRRMMALIRLGNALKLHAQLANDPRSDDESIDAFREAMRGVPGSPAETSDLLVNLGAALLRRYERGGALDDLHEGIGNLRTGIDAMPDGEPRRGALCHLANALRLSFQTSGDLGDLNGAINELLGVLGVLGSGHPLLGRVVWNLASTTSEHVDSTGEPGQLRRVLRALSPAVRGISATDDHRASALAGYGALLRRNFVHGAESDSLDASVSFGDASAEATTVPADRCAMLISLAMTLITRYEHSGDAADLDLATTAAEGAAGLVPEGSATQYGAWTQLGIVSAHRFRRSSLLQELETAVEMFDRALSAMPERAPGRAVVATHLGRALQTLHQRTGRRRLYRWARRVLTEAAEQGTAAADQRMRAATLCGRLAAQAHRWSEAMESFTLAVELLPLVTRGKRVVASPVMQQRWALIAADAAACALEAGEPDRAVELLEHGRAALMSDFLPAGGEIGQLHRDLPELADGAVRLRRLLDRPPDEPALVDVTTLDQDDRGDLAQAWDDLLQDVREVQPEHLRMTPFRDLASVGADGPVVMVNLSRYRSDALIVFGGRALTVSLPGAGLQSAAEQTDTLLAAVERQDSQALAGVLDWLWHNVTRPVLDRMGYTRTPKDGQRWPRVWWSNMGSLTFLPLHAATAWSGHGAMDRVISSYTPALRTLVRAKRQPLPDDGRPLVAAGSQEEIGWELPRSNQILAQYWPSAEIASTESSSGSDLLRMLPSHPWLHVCERSIQYPGQPAAGVVLDRQPPQRALSLLDMGHVSLEEAEFTYLGQCTTVIDTPSAAAVTLAGALGFAGVTHVIGTLWGLDEQTSDQLHTDVYEKVFGGSEFTTDLSAYAVHQAAARMREQHPGDPTRWAAHVHVGP